MFRPYRAIIRPYYTNRFNHFQYILGSQIVYIDGIVVTMLCAIIYVKVKTDFKIEFCLFKILCYGGKTRSKENRNKTYPQGSSIQTSLSERRSVNTEKDKDRSLQILVSRTNNNITSTQSDRSGLRNTVLQQSKTKCRGHQSMSNKYPTTRYE